MRRKPGQKQKRTGLETREGSRRGWGLERNNALMRCLFSGLDPREILDIAGTSWKGVDRQWYKIAQKYIDIDGDLPRPARLVQVDLGLSRQGQPWTNEDYWVICNACNPVGRKHGADDPGRIAKCLGRRVSEVRAEMDRIAGARKGFLMEGEWYYRAIHKNLKDRVAGVSNKIRMALIECDNLKRADK